jgi:hypothetical protein
VIAGLEAWLRCIEPEGAPELEAVLERLLAAGAAPLRFDGGQTLWRSRVHRLRFRPEAAGALPLRPLVVKRLPLDRSHREQQAVRHWLPQVGLGEYGPPLIEVAAARSAACVWHVYEDLGDGTLARFAAEGREPREDAIRSALALISSVHLRFAGHPLLAECRLAGIDLGAGFFAASVGDAARGLTALRRRGALPSEWEVLIDRLRGRLTALSAEGTARTRGFAELGWPETLQHGDLWLTNIMLVPGAAGPQLRLIDWDHAGIGAAIYDLSTFLRQFPTADRPWILDMYRERVRGAGWPWPEPALFDRVAESCELGRFASCLLWRTLFLLQLSRGADPPPEWIFDDLLEMERWFVELTPLLPGREQAGAA